jgi:MoxR-like ATPase
LERETEERIKSTSQDLTGLTAAMNRVRDEISKAIVGQAEVVEGVLNALLAGGHVLLEGVPGLGKTMLVRTLAQTLALKYSRIQFTPDLMPADVIGTTVIHENGDGNKALGFQPGPLFANLLLADEINRTTPKTQSALLEAMQEKQVTVGGTTHLLAEPFLVIATQNPLEMEGTYPLPEAQLDRFFFKLRVPFPHRDELHEILDRTTQATEVTLHARLDGQEIMEMRRIVRTVPVAPHVQDRVVQMIMATHPNNAGNTVAAKYIRYGSSPRGAQTLILGGKVRALLEGRFNVSAEDVRALLLPALRHRIILNFEAHADARTADDLLEEIAATVWKN